MKLVGFTPQERKVFSVATHSCIEKKVMYIDPVSYVRTVGTVDMITEVVDTEKLESLLFYHFKDTTLNYLIDDLWNIGDIVECQEFFIDGKSLSIESEVMVVSSFEDNEEGCLCNWDDDKENYIGVVSKIAFINRHNIGLSLNNEEPRCFPFFVIVPLEKVEPKREVIILNE